MALAVVAAVIAYVALVLLAVIVIPDGYADWGEYLSALAGLSGSKGIPTFNTAATLMGTAGLVILGIAVLSGIITGIIANYVSVSRLVYAMAKDKVFPGVFSKLNSKGIPQNAVILIMAVSVVIPFFGRTAIGWIVEVTTIGAAIAYAYTSLAAFKTAKADKDIPVMVTGIIGFLLSAFFFIYLLVPAIGIGNTISTASYLILVAWSIAGIVVFRILISRDETRRMGKTSVVWVVLLVLITFVSQLWISSSLADNKQAAVDDISSTYKTVIDDLGVDPDDPRVDAAETSLGKSVSKLTDNILGISFVQILLLLASFGLVLSVFSVIQHRERQIESERIRAEQSNKAKTVFLSNMSHDIRTPMNAITGFTALALQEKDLSPVVADYLGKIDYSSKYLLSLINDILDLSRIESGKIELDLAPADFVDVFVRVRDIFETQMREKNLTFTVDTSAVKDRNAVFDEGRLSRILLNLISNALKFTPSGGAVTVKAEQIESDEKEVCYVISVKDNGIGMSEEFSKRVFEAFERERSSTVSKIQGTGLGMAITKSFVDLMNGTIEVRTKQGKGTEFIIGLCFDKAEEADLPAKENEDEEIDFSGLKLLLVDDNPINREIAYLILTHAGFEVDTAENGRDAVDKIAAAREKKYAAVLMDIQMPVLDGYEATKEIRAMGGVNGSVPIIAMTANAFAEDVKKAHDCGMTAHVAKPIKPPSFSTP